MDFIFADLSSDDEYPLFKEMEKKRFPIHYITEEIYIMSFVIKKRNVQPYCL